MACLKVDNLTGGTILSSLGCVAEKEEMIEGIKPGATAKCNPYALSSVKSRMITNGKC